MPILTINNKKEEKFLRRKVPEFNFEKISKKEIQEMIKKMRAIIKKENGVGLSANQLGSDWRFFIAEIPDNKTRTRFYAIFNPEIIKKSEIIIGAEEGCLSIPKYYGEVQRSDKVVLIGYDKNGKKLKIKAWGLLARVFQHEVDHLNGKLFVDHVKRKK